MSIIDLSRRLTDNYEEYARHTKSTDSLVYVDPIVRLEDGPSSFDLTVGDGWFNCSDSRYYAIPNEGVTLRPRDSIVIETRQAVGVPLTAFGLVTGKGKFIFRGVLVSSGKIDPGFCDKLRIGLYNGGHEEVVIKKDEPFCTCCFFEVESSFSVVRRRSSIGPSMILPALPVRVRATAFFKKNWGMLFTLLIAFISLIISIFRGP
jgi:dUTPase